MAQIDISKETIARRDSISLPVTTKITPTDTLGDVAINSRAYQLEMLEESLKKNIIVAMDTGSGKTHVAILRIKHELETSPAPKLIWFLAPTVALCSQQLSVLQSQISSVQIKSLTSTDNVDRWTEKADWDFVLANVRIVVSTYAVLYDALCHAFVSMESIALIVFDEAHNCIGRSPGSKTMQDFYWPRKKDKLFVPHILGLTASPVMGSKLNAMETLESFLDSTCRSPYLQKEELLLHVKRPSLVQVGFESNKASADAFSSTCTMKSLSALYGKLNIYEDPEILRLKTQNTEVSRNQMERALKKDKTYVRDQIKSFCRRSSEIYQALGGWAADFYISQVTSAFIKSAEWRDTRSRQWSDSEMQYLANALRNVDASPGNLSVLSENSISHKARALINFLHSCDEKIIGIIFVKERTTAYMLHRLLSDHSATAHRLRFETVVGTSQRPRGKRDICELPNPENALAEFRSGKINFLIATSVIEEGIDVPRCKLVICFDEPANLKSYIQCRGRARLPESKWVVLLDKTSKNRTMEWEKLEREMKLRYEEEERIILGLIETEASEMTQCSSRQFRVQSTGALLDMENAKGHLQCFCSRLSSHSSVDMRPEYIILEEEQDEDVGGHDDQPLLTAKVILPATLDSSLRTSKSRLSWRSAKNATKDAAFVAYIALYRAGLVNEHLLPLNFTESSKYMEKEDSIVEVQEQFNPWPSVARAWKSKERLQRRDLTLKDQYGLKKCKIDMSIPSDLPDMGPIVIHWDASTEWRIDIGPSRVLEHSELKPDNTTTLLSLAYGHRWEVENMRQVVLFRAIDMDIGQTRLERVSFSHQDCMDDSVGLLRDLQDGGPPYLFHSWPSTKPSLQSIQVPHTEYESFPDDQPFVALKKWPRRSDFLHPVTPGPLPDRREYFSVLPESLLRIDVVPTTYSQFGLLIPSILHHLEVQLVVKELCATVLTDVEISDNELIRTAISTPAAREQDNYEKLEFLGDSVLKFLVSVFVASWYTKYPEGYLSAKKDAIVSNSRLCKAAIDRGLDKFILTKVFTGNKWRPLYVDSFLGSQADETREMPSKTIADVVESLIGAGWKMGSYQTSLSVVKAFLPEFGLPSLEVGRARLFDHAPTDIPLPVDLHALETLAGYSFKKKSLLVQAMSHRSDSAAIASYERLEFLGDSILETIVVTELAGYEDKLTHSLMHLYKTALVNGDYLGFIALEWNITQKRTDLKEDRLTGVMKEVESKISLPLWRFMRHWLFEVGNKQREVERRHASLRCEILKAIESGTNYPWTLLARINANKFYSDLVESLLGAVWVDSGSMELCKQLLSRMGILKYLHRIVQDQVHVVNPREELGILAKDKEVKYEVRKMDDGSDEWSCTVFVGETRVSEATQGVSSDEVRTRAAEIAVSSLRFANGRSGSPVAYGERILRYCHR